MKSYSVKSGSRQSRQNTRDAIVNREEFKTGGGLTGGRPSGEFGGLPEKAWIAYLNLASAISYVVFSYKTPIAWWADGFGWTVVTDYFGPTTSVHQGVVRAALSAAGYKYKEVGDS